MSLFNFKKSTKQITVLAHSGSFHPDDVFAVAALSLVIKDPFTVIRSRDAEKIKAATYVVDVGVISDPEANRFDHHQQGGAGMRSNGIPYASFGLVWKKYGEQICGSKGVADIIDQRLVQPIDAIDNGVEILKKIYEDVQPYLINYAIFSFLPSWKEKDKSMDEAFLEAVSLAKKILEREIIKTRDREEGKQFVEQAYAEAKDKRIIVIDNDYSWGEVLAAYPEPLYAIYPSADHLSWHLKAIRSDITSFKARKDLPVSWAGKQAEELSALTGVKDAVFCHNARFMAVSKSKEGAIRLAQIAVE